MSRWEWIGAAPNSRTARRVKRMVRMGLFYSLASIRNVVNGVRAERSRSDAGLPTQDFIGVFEWTFHDGVLGDRYSTIPRCPRFPISPAKTAPPRSRHVSVCADSQHGYPPSGVESISVCNFLDSVLSVPGPLGPGCSAVSTS